MASNNCQTTQNGEWNFIPCKTPSQKQKQMMRVHCGWNEGAFWKNCYPLYIGGVRTCYTKEKKTILLCIATAHT